MTSLSPSFIEQLSSDNSEIDEIVMSDSFLIAFKIKYQGLVEYFKKHSLDVLHSIIKPEPKEPNIRLYRCILSADPEFLHPFVRSQSFTKELVSIIKDPNVSNSIVVRLSHLIAELLIKVPNDIPPNYPVIDALLRVVQKPAIFNIFESILTAEQTPAATLVYFKTEKLQDKIYDNLKELEELPSDSGEDANVFGLNDSRRLALLQITVKCSLNTTLMFAFKNDKLTTVIAAQPKNLPHYIKTAKWSAIRHTAVQRMPNNLSNLIPEALQNIREIKDAKHIRGYHAFSIMFINHMLVHEPQLTIDSLSPIEKFLDDVIEGILHFPNSTNLHSAFRAFVDIALHAKGLAEIVCPKYMPIFIKNSTGRPNKVLSATLNDLAMKMIDMGRQSKTIKESLRPVTDFPVFATTELVEYRNIIKENYGVDPPSRLYKFFAKFFE